MELDRVGRRLGVGVRVASGMLRDRAAQTAQQTAQTVRQDAPVYAARAKNVAIGTKSGAKRFGESVWGPFVHAGGVLWLEVTGLFFAIFSLFFVQGAFRLRVDWRYGPHHVRLLMYAAVAVIFLYFAASSFYRAHKKQKRKTQRQ